MSRDGAYLIDLVKAGDRIANYVVGLDRELVRNLTEKRAAILYELLVIGEAVKRLSKEFRLANPEIDWGRFSGMRDVIIHGYDRVDFDLVWEAVETRLPELLEAIRPLLPPRPPKASP